MSTIEITVDKQQLESPPGIALHELFHEIGMGRETVAALLNNRLVSLNTKLYHPVRVVPIHRSSQHAKSILVRSAHHVLYTAMSECFPDLIAEVGQSLPSGFYHVLMNREELGLDGQHIATRLTEACNELIDRDLPFVPQRVPVEAVPDSVCDPNNYRSRLLRTWPTPMVPLICLEEFADLQHGPYVPSTGYLDKVNLKSLDQGVVLELDDKPADPPRAQILLKSFTETRRWNRKLGVTTVGDLNAALLEGHMGEVVRVSEAFHEKKIAQIADDICGRHDQVRMVCIAGPSSAGKTTFVRRLRVQMLVNGVKPVSLGLDDYYRNRTDIALGEDGTPDFEALDALNTELLSDHLTRLVRGEQVAIPRFDFKLGKCVPEDEWQPLRLEPHQVLMIEGLHGLNPALAPEVERSSKYLIFINALTQLILDEHTRMPTSKARLLRRIVRDRRYRNSPAGETLSMWPKVRAGEVKYIFPFQGDADALFNSSLVYETAVLRNLAWRFLLEVPRTDPYHCEAYQLLKFLEHFVPVEEKQVPSNSVLREFLGDSSFVY
jgi:uridine kinase